MILLAGNLENVETFNKAEEHLIDTQKKHQIYGTATIINSAKIIKELPEDVEPKLITSLLITLLNACDTIYMLTGWEHDLDARVLHEYANANQYQIIYSKKF